MVLTTFTYIASLCTGITAILALAVMLIKPLRNRFFDFTACATVPTLAYNNIFDLPYDCQIRVPAALVNEWKAATNWSTYADHIVGCKDDSKRILYTAKCRAGMMGGSSNFNN